MPCSSRMRRTRAPISSTIRGARPRNGSSIIRSFGRAIRPRAIATICCSPPESVCASCERRVLSKREKGFEARERFLAMRAGARIVGAEEHVVVHGEKGKQPPALEHVRNADARAPVGGQAVDALALEA